MNSLMIMVLSLSLMFLMTNHPLSMSIILTTQSIIMAILMGFMYESFWYSYLLIIIMLSSIMMMFIYMTSLISNKKIKINLSLFVLLLMTPFMITQFLYNTNKFLYKSPSNINIHKNINKMFSDKSLILMYMFILLFLTMIFINKLVNLKMGPIRKINDKL